MLTSGTIGSKEWTVTSNRGHYKKTCLWNVKKSARVKCMEFNGNINFLAALLDGLPTPERSERLEVKNDDSSTAQAQNIHRGAASLSANYNLPHRMRSPLNRVHFE